MRSNTGNGPQIGMAQIVLNIIAHGYGNQYLNPRPWPGERVDIAGAADQQDVGAGGALPLMCRPDSTSVFTGQVRVTAKPASI